MRKWTKKEWDEYWERQHEQTLKDLATIKKAEEELFFLEEKLHLHERAMHAAEAAERLLAMPMSDEVRQGIEALLESLGLPPHN